MSFLGLLNHKCDIYHLNTEMVAPRPGLTPTPAHGYSDYPDVANVPCHFGVKSSNLTITQGEPNASFEAKIKLVVPAGTDIRLNDKIVGVDAGYQYTAEIPRDIRGHHTYVYLHRNASQAPL